MTVRYLTALVTLLLAGPRRIDVAAALGLRQEALEYEREVRAAKAAFWVTAVWERSDGKVGIRAEISSKPHEFVVEMPR